MMNFGWIPPQDRTPAVQRRYEAVFAAMPFPHFSAAGANLAGSGAGKVALLWKAVEKLTGKPLEPWNQGQAGTCVSFGWGLGVTTLMAVEIALKAEREEFAGMVATEPIYALSRVEIGKGQLGNQDGSMGAWAAEAVRQYGVLLQQPYGDVDLTHYDPRRAQSWGARGKGLPDQLEPIAKEHPVKATSQVTTYEQARDAIANGYPVPVCSNQGFSETRDREGFARPQGSWGHCMLFFGVDDDAPRPGLCCMNSWAVWNSGPKRHEQPDGSFWVDADTADKMLGGGDSFAVSNFQGFPARQFDWHKDWPRV